MTEEYLRSNIPTAGYTTTILSNDSISNNEEDISRMIQVIERPLLIAFGTIGNLLSFFVMQRGSLKKVPTCFYMSILALADTGKCSLFLPWTRSNFHGKI